MDSILDTVKLSVNVDPSDTSFDIELLLSINMSIFKLAQLAVKVDPYIEIVDNTQTWLDTFPDNIAQLAAIKTYMRLNARLDFDPPASSFAKSALESQKTELEWRLNTQVEGVIVK